MKPGCEGRAACLWTLSVGQIWRLLHQLQEDLLNRVLDFGAAAEQKGREFQARGLVSIDELPKGVRVSASKGSKELLVVGLFHVYARSS